MVEELLIPLYTTEKGRYLGLGLLVLVGVILFFTLIDTFYTWHADAVLTSTQPALPSSQSLEEAAQLVADIPAAHLFGQAADDDFMPITSLQMHLTGIIKDPVSKLSRAIISEGGQSGKIFSVGDELTAGIKIYAINPDNVVLEHAGHLEKLPLTRSTLEFQDMPKPLWPRER